MDGNRPNPRAVAFIAGLGRVLAVHGELTWSLCESPPVEGRRPHVFVRGDSAAAEPAPED